MRIFRSLLAAVCGAGVCLSGLFAVPAWAQSAATLEAFQKEPHLGTLDDAVVGITVVNRAADGSVQTRHGNGMMLRCDGFVLAPEALFDVRNVPNGNVGKPNQTITVVLHPGTEREKFVVGRRPGWFGWVEAGNTRQHLSYAVLKLDNAHCPALRTLMPDTLAVGDRLTLAWSRWDDDKQRFAAVQTRPLAAGERKPSVPNDPVPAVYREQFTRLAAPLEAAMPGAIVVGPENLAVGMVPGKAPSNTSQFANFASLRLATNCVTPLPVSDSDFVKRNKTFAASASSSALNGATSPLPAALAAQQAKANAASGAQQKPGMSKLDRDVAASASDMAAVGGGPVRLPPALVDMQLDMEVSRVACVAPFLIDRYEVTNAQYLTFWNSLDEKMRQDKNIRADMYPYGWAEKGEPFPDNLAQVPVLGVRLPGARAYAQWAGKRLPTPYEWCLAAFGPTGGNEMPAWSKRFLKQRKDVWNKIVQAHEQYAREHANLLPKFELNLKAVLVGKDDYTFEPVQDRDGNIYFKQDLSHPSIAEFFHLPWFFYKAEHQEAAAWSKQIIEELTDPLFQEWIDPMYVLPVGSRPYDVSPYGAFDMLTNAKELVQPGPIFPWNTLPYPNWPTGETDRYMDVQWDIQDVLARTSALQHFNKRYQADIGFLPVDVARTQLDAIDTRLNLASFGVNPLLLWIGTPNYISNGNLVAPVLTPRGWPDTRLSSLPLLAVPRNYTNMMLSRRLRSGAQNRRPDSSDYVLSDIAEYASVRASMDEVNEMLRPAEDMIVGMDVGPTHDMVYYPFRETIIHHWVVNQNVGVSHFIPNTRFRKVFPEQYSLFRSGPPSLQDMPTYVNGTWITQAGSFALWRGTPRHYHQEMGHPVGEDENRPYSDHDRPYIKLGDDPSGKAATNTSRLFAPDTFLVPGGFRCVR